jgi:hypothetical protein
MRLSKQHKIYAAVLGLALAALGADRFLSSSGPAETSAESYAVTTSKTSHAAPTKVAAAAAQSKGAEVPEDRRAISGRLDELARVAGLSGGESGDAFVPHGAWVGSNDDGGQRAALEKAHKFVADHRLTAVMEGNGRSVVAIVDGKPLRPGQTLDGFTLVSVSGRDVKAVFERSGSARIELRLNKGTTVPVITPAAAVAQAN